MEGSYSLKNLIESAKLIVELENIYQKHFSEGKNLNKIKSINDPKLIENIKFRCISFMKELVRNHSLEEES